MSLIDDIDFRWRSSNHDRPQYLLIFFENKYLPVISDNGLFIRFNGIKVVIFS